MGLPEREDETYTYGFEVVGLPEGEDEACRKNCDVGLLEGEDEACRYICGVVGLSEVEGEVCDRRMDSTAD